MFPGHPLFGFIRVITSHIHHVLETDSPGRLELCLLGDILLTVQMLQSCLLISTTFECSGCTRCITALVMEGWVRAIRWRNTVPRGAESPVSMQFLRDWPVMEHSLCIWLEEDQVAEFDPIWRSRDISRAAACEKNGSMKVSVTDLNIYVRSLWWYITGSTADWHSL